MCSPRHGWGIGSTQQISHVLVVKGVGMVTRHTSVATPPSELRRSSPYRNSTHRLPTPRVSDNSTRALWGIWLPRRVFGPSNTSCFQLCLLYRCTKCLLIEGGGRGSLPRLKRSRSAEQLATASHPTMQTLGPRLGISASVSLRRQRIEASVVCMTEQ